MRHEFLLYCNQKNNYNSRKPALWLINCCCHESHGFSAFCTHYHNNWLFTDQSMTWMISRVVNYHETKHHLQVDYLFWFHDNSQLLISFRSYFDLWIINCFNPLSITGHMTTKHAHSTTCARWSLLLYNIISIDILIKWIKLDWKYPLTYWCWCVITIML